MLVFQQKEMFMKQFLPVLSCSPLMKGITPEETLRLLTCLDSQLISFQKGNIILQQDDPAKYFGIVLAGSVQVLRGDMHGSHTIIAEIQNGELFGETFACAAIPALPVNVLAKTDCTVLLLEHARVIRACSRPCIAHSRMILNLLRLTAQKTLLLNRKLEIVMQRTTRDKLMAYLHAQAQNAGSTRFVIPFDRQELADYLGVERSAMSTELNKLKKAGIIDFHKNEFQLLSR